MQSPDLTHQDSEMIPEVNVERFQIAPPVQNLANNPIAQQYLNEGGQLGQAEQPPVYQQLPQMGNLHLNQTPASIEHEQRLKAVEERLMKVEFQTGEQREQQMQFENNKRMEQFHGSNGSQYSQLQDLNVRRTSVVKNTETQTVVRMDALNPYDLSAKTDKTDKLKAPSDPHGSSTNDYNTYKENSVNTGDRDKSDFG